MISVFDCVAVQVRDCSTGLSLFHDENSNTELDTTFLIFADVPNEGIGFSNNPSIGTSAPSWDDVKFTFNNANRTLNISLTYLL